MKILKHVEIIRRKVKDTGGYKRMAELSGVSESWLAKFANGKIPNPTVDSIDKLEKVFSSDRHRDSSI